MRILVLSSFYSNPANRGKLRALAGLGCDVVAAVPDGVAGVDGGVRMAPIPTSGSVTEPSTLRWNARALKRLISDSHPDLIQIEEDPETPAAAVTARLATQLAVPYIVFSWKRLPNRLGWLAGRRAKRTLAAAAGAIGGSHDAETRLRELAPNALTATLPQAGTPLPSTVDLHRDPTDELSIGFVGRLVPERGLDLVLLALSQTFGKWRLSVLGTGPEQEAAEALAQRLGLASRIRWLGGTTRDSLAQLWHEIDCFVVPSRDTATWIGKSAPLLLDAMAHGIAPIVTRAGSLPDVVGDTGLVAGDQDELMVAIQTYVTNPAACRQAGARARARVLTQYSESAVASRTLAFWDAVLHSSKTRS